MAPLNLNVEHWIFISKCEFYKNDFLQFEYHYQSGGYPNNEYQSSRYSILMTNINKVDIQNSNPQMKVLKKV